MVVELGPYWFPTEPFKEQLLPAGRLDGAASADQTVDTPLEYVYSGYIIMRILKRGITVSAQQPAVVNVPAVVVQVGDQTLIMPATSHYDRPRVTDRSAALSGFAEALNAGTPPVAVVAPARPPRRLPYTNRPPVPIPAPDAVVAPVPLAEQPPVIAPAPAALAVQTPALRLQQTSTSAWERIERIDRYRLLRGLKLRMRVIVTVCDSERHTYANWPSATATIEVGEAGQPGIENGKDLVWAIDELVEAVGRVGPEKVARVLREVRPVRVEPGVPVVAREARSEERSA